MGDGARHSVIELPARPVYVGEARRRVAKRLADWGADPEELDSAVLVVSEMVTYALLRTAGSRLVCDLWAGQGQLYIELKDQTTKARQDTANHWDFMALVLVSRLAQSWGVALGPQGRGQVLWAVLSLGGWGRPIPPRPRPT